MHSKPTGLRNPGSPSQRHPQEADMPGLLRGIARTAVIAGTASAVGGRVRHRQDQKWAAQDQAAAPPPEEQPYEEAPAAVPAPRTTTDKLADLKSLGELKAQGVLTEEEFAAQKAKIL